MSEPRIIPLSAIVGRSRFNVRPDGDQAGRAAMAASIRAMGQLQALIVRDEGTPGLYEVDDGGCRWDAMCDLVAADEVAPPDHAEPWTWNTDVNVLVVNGNAGRARERSLAANVIRRNLHPVEECEAFADMVRDGLSIERVAADFAVTARYVRQRLKLDELSTRARNAWRAGKLSAEAAGVLTSAGDHAAQDAILDRFRDGEALVNYNITALRAELRQKAVRGDTPQALFIGVDAYVAAGGKVDEQLFDTAPLFLDAVLLKSLTVKRLMDLGHELAASYGYGHVISPDDLPDNEHWHWGNLTSLTVGERDELHRLDEMEAAELDGLGDLAKAEVTAKYDGLTQRFVARAIEGRTTAAERAAAAIFVSLDTDGRPHVDFGRTPPKADRSEAARASAPRPFVSAPELDAAGEPTEPARLGTRDGARRRLVGRLRRARTKPPDVGAHSRHHGPNGAQQRIAGTPRR